WFSTALDKITVLIAPGWFRLVPGWFRLVPGPVPARARPAPGSCPVRSPRLAPRRARPAGSAPRRARLASRRAVPGWLRPAPRERLAGQWPASGRATSRCRRPAS
ncbi:MAG TPA: hypothetical protein VGG16_19150, partial [Streptosporangiaceae bacterium]